MGVLKVRENGQWTSLPSVPSTMAPTGSDKQVQFNNAGVLGAASVVEIDGDDLQLVGQTTMPAAPAAGRCKIVAINFGNTSWPFLILPNGKPGLIQPAGWTSLTGYWTSYNGVGGLGGMGFATQGNLQANSVTAASALMRSKRAVYAYTGASASNCVGIRTTNTHLAMGSVNGGGFLGAMRFGPTTGQTNASHRLFCGLMATGAAPTDVNPSTLLNMFGIGWDSADTQIQFMYNDGSGTASKVALGTSWLKPSVDNTSVYELVMHQPSGSYEVNWLLINLTNYAMIGGVVTTDLPAAMTMLMPNLYASVGGVSAVIGLAILGIEFWSAV